MQSRSRLQSMLTSTLMFLRAFKTSKILCSYHERYSCGRSPQKRIESVLPTVIIARRPRCTAHSSFVFPVLAWIQCSVAESWYSNSNSNKRTREEIVHSSILRSCHWMVTLGLSWFSTVFVRKQLPAVPAIG